MRPPEDRCPGPDFLSSCRRSDTTSSRDALGGRHRTGSDGRWARRLGARALPQAPNQDSDWHCKGGNIPGGLPGLLHRRSTAAPPRTLAGSGDIISIWPADPSTRTAVPEREGGGVPAPERRPIQYRGGRTTPSHRHRIGPNGDAAAAKDAEGHGKTAALRRLAGAGCRAPTLRELRKREEIRAQTGHPRAFGGGWGVLLWRYRNTASGTPPANATIRALRLMRQRLWVCSDRPERTGQRVSFNGSPPRTQTDQPLRATVIADAIAFRAPETKAEAAKTR
jgi:hypothetical protein